MALRLPAPGPQRSGIGGHVIDRPALGTTPPCDMTAVGEEPQSVELQEPRRADAAAGQKHGTILSICQGRATALAQRAQETRFAGRVRIARWFGEPDGNARMVMEGR
jgi:hypothetical protein